MARIALLALCALILVGAIAPAHQFSEGQVWEYRTRPGDKGSLLKIQKIERVPAFARYGPDLHVAIIGVRFGKRTDPSDSIDHAPFSRGALDASVIQLYRLDRRFPRCRRRHRRMAQGGRRGVRRAVAKAVESVAETLRRADKAKR